MVEGGISVKGWAREAFRSRDGCRGGVARLSGGCRGVARLMVGWGNGEGWV